MVFTSAIFVFLFLPIFLISYVIFPKNIKWQNPLILLSSLFFYIWGEPQYIFLVLISCGVDWFLSLLLIPKAKLSDKSKKFILTVAIILNLSLLVFAKYMHFIFHDLLNFSNEVSHSASFNSSLPLILGISFITFHKISFLVDSYKQTYFRHPDFLEYLIYIFLFPQLIAGPIVRYHTIGQQIYSRTFSYDNFYQGLVRFIIGLGKKTLLADPLGITVDHVFSIDVHFLPSSVCWLSIFCYSLQIYLDFSAYSDMAIGLAKVMGFNFPENFNYPYCAKSINDFWKRWHISLTSWMREYLYIPLGGNRRGSFRNFLNLWIVFLLSGVWHGANWTFIIWGAYHGFFLTIEKTQLFYWVQQKINIPKVFSQVITFFIVMNGWIFFRSPNLAFAIEFIKKMYSFGYYLKSYPFSLGSVFFNQTIIVLMIGFCISFIPMKNFIFWNNHVEGYNENLLISNARFLISCALLLITGAYILSTSYSPFLYFRF